MILLSDELWLIANDSKGFKNGSKSIIRNNLGLCKRSEIYLNYNFQKHCYGSTGKKKSIWQGSEYQTSQWYLRVTEKNGEFRYFVKRSCPKNKRAPLIWATSMFISYLHCFRQKQIFEKKQMVKDSAWRPDVVLALNYP